MVWMLYISAVLVLAKQNQRCCCVARTSTALMLCCKKFKMIGKMLSGRIQACSRQDTSMLRLSQHLTGAEAMPNVPDVPGVPALYRSRAPPQ